MVSLELEGVHLDSSLNSMVQLGDKLWILTALLKHKEGECIDLHKAFVIVNDLQCPKCFTFTNVSNLLMPCNCKLSQLVFAD